MVSRKSRNKAQMLKRILDTPSILGVSSNFVLGVLRVLEYRRPKYSEYLEYEQY